MNMLRYSALAAKESYQPDTKLVFPYEDEVHRQMVGKLLDIH
jgi:hypothetical protein